MKMVRTFALLVAVLLIAAPSVMAQQAVAIEDQFDEDELLNIQMFRPSIFGGSFISFDDGKTLDTLGFHIGVLGNYTSALLVDYENDEPNFNYIEDLITGDFMLAFGTWDFLSIGVDVPVHYIRARNLLVLTDPTSTDTTVTDLAEVKDEDVEGEFVFGDVRAALKFGLLKQEKHWLNWAITPYATLPTGDAKQLLGEGRATFGGSTTFEHDFGIFNIGLNGGYLYRGESMLFGTDVGDAITWGAGLSKDWDNGIGFSLEYFGKYFTVEDTDLYRPLAAEGLATLRYQFGERGPRLIAGAGPGAARGVGTPTYRIIGGLDYTYSSPEPTDGQLVIRTIDADGNEIVAQVEISGPEDYDETYQVDGTWKRVVLAGAYDIKATADGYESASASADVPVDELAQATITLKKIPAVIPTILSIRTIDAETGVDVGSTLIFDWNADGKKVYPNPSGVLSAEWAVGAHTLKIRAKGHETLCTQVVIEANKTNEYIFKLRQHLNVSGSILFKVNSAKLKAASFPVLDNVVQQINELCEYERIVVEGHTSSEGSDATNMKLSQGRANSVRDYLLSKGIPAANLEVEAFGETKPIADNTTKEGREKNRRVEFRIVTGN
jgi:OmpA-OmpF porin, OOP family